MSNVLSGKEIFVGIGKNTNEAGAQAVAEAFPEYVASLIQFFFQFYSYTYWNLDILKGLPAI